MLLFSALAITPTAVAPGPVGLPLLATGYCISGLALAISPYSLRPSPSASLAPAQPPILPPAYCLSGSRFLVYLSPIGSGSLPQQLSSSLLPLLGSGLLPSRPWPNPCCWLRPTASAEWLPIHRFDWLRLTAPLAKAPAQLPVLAPAYSLRGSGSGPTPPPPPSLSAPAYSNCIKGLATKFPSSTPA